MRTSLFLLVVVATGVLAAEPPAPGTKKPTAEEVRKQLQGRWVLRSIENAGNKNMLPEENALVLVVKDDKLIIGDKTVGSFRLETETDPPLLDVTLEDDKKQVLEGIYELNGDVWRISLMDNGQGVKQRPTKFTTSAEDSGYNVVLLLREGTTQKP